MTCRLSSKADLTENVLRHRERTEQRVVRYVGRNQHTNQAVFSNDHDIVEVDAAIIFIVDGIGHDSVSGNCIRLCQSENTSYYFRSYRWILRDLLELYQINRL